MSSKSASSQNSQGLLNHSQLLNDLANLETHPSILDRFSSTSSSSTAKHNLTPSDAQLSINSIPEAVTSSYVFTQTMRNTVLNRNNDQVLAHVGETLEKVRTEAEELQAGVERVK